jgi:hypothetical protein
MTRPTILSLSKALSDFNPIKLRKPGLHGSSVKHHHTNMTLTSVTKLRLESLKSYNLLERSSMSMFIYKPTFYRSLLFPSPESMW